MLSRIKSVIFNVFSKRVLKNRGTIVYFNEGESKELFDLVGGIMKEVRLLLSYAEAIQIYKTVSSLSKIGGGMAEVGSYEGGSAKIIHLADKNKELHLFDTFSGLPNDDVVRTDIKKGEYIASYEKVTEYLKEYKNVFIYKGFFPDTSGPIVNKRFSFVHIDTDLYKATLDTLDFFYGRINPGGVIISHDYSANEGVKKAFDEFFKDKPEAVLWIAGTSQCLVVKI